MDEEEASFLIHIYDSHCYTDITLCHCLHYILFGTWVVADNENIWNKNNGDNALQYWTIKNTEAQHVAIIEDEGKLVESSVMSWAQD